MNTYYNPIYIEEETLAYFVRCIGSIENQNHIIRPEGYPAHQWLYCVKGKGCIIVGGCKQDIMQGMGYYIPKGMPHEYFGVEEPFTTEFLAFDGYGVEALLKVLKLTEFAGYYVKEARFLDSLMEDIFRITKKTDQYIGLKSSGLLYTYLIELGGKIHLVDSTDTSEQDRKVEKVINYFEKHYGQVIQLDEVAKLVGTSKQYLCRMFKECQNKTPMEYLEIIRIQKAKDLLINTLEPVSVITELVGYNSQSYFGSIFKKREGTSPLDYRKLYS